MESNKEKTHPNEVDSARLINALTEYIPASSPRMVFYQTI